MINSQLFTILNSDIQVKLRLGSNPLRVYPWGRAPSDVKKPYAVYAVYSGVPENYLGQVPDIDNKGTQINIYADTADSLEKCFIAVRNSLEPHAHMTNFTTPDQDADTNLFSCRMEFDFWENRS